MLTIKPEGNRAFIEGDIPARLEQLLMSDFVWCDITNLNQQVYFYAEGTMYLGIMYDVAERIREQGYKCRIELPEELPQQYPWKFTGKFRPHQEDAVNAMLDARYGVLKAAPGFGKTVSMAAILSKVGLNTVIIVQAGEPFDQAYNTVRAMTNIKRVGRVSGDVKDIQPVTVMMVQTLNKEVDNNPDGEIAEFLRNADVVMVDECHHAGSDSYINILRHVEAPKYLLGFSATPDAREDGLQPFVDAYVGTPRYEVTYGEQVARGGLCPVTVYAMRMKPKDYGYAKDKKIPTFRKRALYKAVYDDYIVRNYDRNMEGIEFAKEMIMDKHSVAIIVSVVSHAKIINDLYPEAIMLTGSTNTKLRREIISKLRRKEIMCVVTTLFDEATDIPSLGAVCMLAGGKAEIRLRQRIRSTRTFSGDTALGYYVKKRGYVWYPVDDADFVKTHSAKCMTLLRSIVSEHDDNELIWI